MNKKFLALCLVFVLVFSSLGSVFAITDPGAGTNPEGSVPNNEVIAGFYKGVLTQYFDVSAYEPLDKSELAKPWPVWPSWTSLDFDNPDTTELVSSVVTNGLHSANGTEYLTHKNNGDSFFEAIKMPSPKNDSMDAFRSSGYIYLYEGTTPMQITSDDGFKFIIDTNNDDGFEIYTTAASDWSLHSSHKVPFFVTVPSDGYYKYKLDYFNWGGDGIIKWETGALITPGSDGNEGPAYASITNYSYAKVNPDTLYLYKEPESPNVPEPSDNPPAAPAPVQVPEVPLTLIVEGPGSAAPAGTGNFSLNSIVIMNTNPADGAVFVGWFGENGSEVTDNRISMTAGKTVIARFEIPVPVVEVVPEVVPETVPSVEPSIEPIPEPISEIIVTEEPVAEAAPVLPKTGGLPLNLLFGFGTLLTASGFALKRKHK